MRVGRIASLIATLALAGCSSGLPMSLAELGAGAMREAPPGVGSPARLRALPRRQGVFGRLGSINLQLGGRGLDDSAWSPVDRPTVFGLEGEYRLADSPLGVEAGASIAYDDGSSGSGIGIRSLLYEVYFGPRVTISFPYSPVDLYVGGGLTFVGAQRVAEFMATKVDDVDRSPGAYLHAGTQVWVSDVFAIGADVRLVSGTDVDLLGVQNLDYVQLALTVGFGF